MKLRLLFILSFLVILYSQWASAAITEKSSTTNDSINDTISHISATSSSLTGDAKDMSLFEKGIIAYNQGDFYQAIAFFKEEMTSKAEDNMESPELYYNLGNAYYRTQNLGYARLYYEKALLLDPDYDRAKQNIKFLETKLENKIPDIDIFFASIWFRYFQQLHSSNTWNTLGIVSFLLLLGMVAVFFFTRKITVKKTAFYMGFILFVFCIFANIFAYKQAQELTKRTNAIVITPVTNVYSSPDTHQREAFTLNEGTKVEITKDDKNWVEIEIGDGNVGWIQSEKLAII